jgi:hypothetical protein
MPLAPGTRLGTYVIEAPLGAGGMGEVYRARDTKLDRHVAIKVLAQPFAADGERLARFEREAKTLAALNHPHIAQVHGVIEQPPALVMELVDGEDLAHRLLRGPIPLDDAIPIAQQIADALEAAHERGIIHRDLKPANIKIRPDGTAKVLDFGLAKTLDPLLVDGAADVTNSPTFTSPAMTNVGAILGTAAYMAPEQARGKPIDKRTDIWAFGAVLYEMLTGRPAFTGQTVTDVLAAVVTRDLDWRALPANTPSSVRRLLVRCLERDTKKRLRDIGDARLELDANAVGTVAPPHGERRWGLPVWTLPIAVLTPAAATAVMAFLLWPEPSARPVRRFDLQARGLRADTMRHPVISPDGQRIAWAAAASLWVRDLDRTESRMVARDVDPMHLAWSPDSREVVYFSAKRLWRVRTDGGAPVIVAEAGFPRGGFTPGAVWLPDGRIIFAPAAFESGLLVVPAQGGEFQTLFEPPEGIADFHSPSLLPDNRGVLLVVDRVEGGTDSIQVFADGRLHQLIEAKGERFEGPVYSATGHLLYERQVLA